MRINVPLLTIAVVVGVERRTPRPLRFSLRGLMLGVAAAGLWLSVAAYGGRLRQAGSYHAIQVAKVAPFTGNTPADKVNIRKSIVYHSRAELVELLLLSVLAVAALLGADAVLGAVAHARQTRSALPAPEGPQTAPPAAPIPT